MKNLLSYKFPTQFFGREIKEWIKYHIDHETEYTGIARHMERFLNISDDDLYYIDPHSEGVGCGEVNKYPIVRRVGPKSWGGGEQYDRFSAVCFG